MEPTAWQGFPIHTLVFQTLILLHFSLTETAHSLSFSLLRLTETAHSLSFSLRLTETAHSLSFSLLRLTETAHSLSFSLLRLTETAHSLTFWLPAVNPTKMYTFCNLLRSCSAFLVRLAPTLNTTTEISANPKRDKQPTWERTCCYISISWYLTWNT